MNTAFFDVTDGDLSIRNNPGSGEDDLDDEAAAWLRGDHAPALALQAAHDAKIRARATSTREERAKALHNAGESVSEICRRVGWTRRKTEAFLGGKPSISVNGVDYKKAREMRAAGKKLKDIAAELGCSVSRVSEVTSTQSSKEIPAKQILSLRAQGWTFRQIMKECKVSTLTVQRVLACA